MMVVQYINFSIHIDIKSEGTKHLILLLKKKSPRLLSFSYEKKS